jgi:hypothetical protein
MLTLLSSAFSWVMSKPKLALYLVCSAVVFSAGWKAAAFWYAGDIVAGEVCEDTTQLKVAAALTAVDNSNLKAALALAQDYAATQRRVAEASDAAVTQLLADKRATATKTAATSVEFRKLITEARKHDTPQTDCLDMALPTGINDWLRSNTTTATNAGLE